MTNTSKIADFIQEIERDGYNLDTARKELEEFKMKNPSKIEQIDDALAVFKSWVRKMEYDCFLKNPDIFRHTKAILEALEFHKRALEINVDPPSEALVMLAERAHDNSKSQYPFEDVVKAILKQLGIGGEE